MNPRDALLTVEIAIFALGAMLSVGGFLRLARRQGREAGWLVPLQRALLGPAAVLPLAAGLLAAALGADARIVLAMAIAGLLLGSGLAAWTLLRLPRALLLPQAGQLLAQSLDDGVLVLDERGRVLYHNPAAQAIFGAESLVSRPLAELLAIWWQPVLQLWEEGQTDFEFTLPDGSFRLRAIPLAGTGVPGAAPGRRVILLSDLSKQRGLERRLEALQTTDTLTGLANRSRLQEMAAREVYRASRYHRPLSVLMIQVDEFSSLVGQYGYAVGEQVLQTLARRCRENIRLADSLARWSEDTFALLLPETNLEQGRLAAERIRRILSGTPILTSRGEVDVTLTAGVSAWNDASPATVDLLLDQAASALYAERSGLSIAPRLTPEPAVVTRLIRGR